MKSFIEEFKRFALKGNVIDMAVAVAIGAAFNNIVNSLVNDIITPIFAALTSNVKFEDLKIILKYTDDGNITLNIGTFVQYCINFVIIAFSIFVVIKFMNKIKDQAVKDIDESKLIRDVKETITKIKKD